MMSMLWNYVLGASCFRGVELQGVFDTSLSFSFLSISRNTHPNASILPLVANIAMKFPSYGGDSSDDLPGLLSFFFEGLR